MPYFLIKSKTYFLHDLYIREILPSTRSFRYLISVFSCEDDSDFQATEFLEISVIRLGVLGSQETARSQ